jgi:hypothetical protein
VKTAGNERLNGKGELDFIWNRTGLNGVGLKTQYELLYLNTIRGRAVCMCRPDSNIMRITHTGGTKIGPKFHI